MCVAYVSCVCFVCVCCTLIQQTIWDNLTYGNDSVTREEVWAICQAVNLHDWIRSLPKGYDSLIGTEIPPSGGQAQRTHFTCSV